ncbi:MAG: site-specific integrase [Desulfovibrio sp.]|jgi:integrase|nr:site-specific integrase [Desulfovibrio sp.]
MSDKTNRKYNKTKFEGVFYRLSPKRDPKTGQQDRVYAFWYADHEGKGHWKTVGRHSQGVRPQTARNARAEYLAEIAATGVSPREREKVTVGQAVEAYLAWGRNEGKYVDQHYRQYVAHVKAKIHTTPIVEVTPGLLSALKGELLKAPIKTAKPRKGDKANPAKLLAGSTVNNIFNFMRSSINRAIATGMWNGANPLSTKGGVWRMVKINNSRLRFFTRDEARALLADLEAVNPQLRDMSLLSLRTGLRCTEIFKLKGADVDANAGVLHVIAKGGHRKPVRVPEDMIAMLQAYDRKPGEPIFQAPITGKALTKTPAAFGFAVKRLGLAPEDGNTLYAVTFHTLRHTFASWLAQSGKVSLIELKDLMRHANINMTMRYAHLIPGQATEKLSIINDVLA